MEGIKEWSSDLTENQKEFIDFVDKASIAVPVIGEVGKVVVSVGEVAIKVGIKEFLSAEAIQSLKFFSRVAVTPEGIPISVFENPVSKPPLSSGTTLREAESGVSNQGPSQHLQKMILLVIKICTLIVSIFLIELS